MAPFLSRSSSLPLRLPLAGHQLTRGKHRDGGPQRLLDVDRGDAIHGHREQRHPPCPRYVLTRGADNELIDRRARNSPQGEHIRGNRIKLLRLDYLVYVLDFLPQRRCKAQA